MRYDKVVIQVGVQLINSSLEILMQSEGDPCFDEK